LPKEPYIASRVTCEWAMSHMNKTRQICTSHVTNMYESCHTRDSVTDLFCIHTHLFYVSFFWYEILWRISIAVHTSITCANLLCHTHVWLFNRPLLYFHTFLSCVFFFRCEILSKIGIAVHTFITCANAQCHTHMCLFNRPLLHLHTFLLCVSFSYEKLLRIIMQGGVES